MNFNQNLTISKDLLSQEISGETVLLDLNSESYFGLDEVGTRIWQLLQEHGNVQKIYDTLLEEYDVDAELLKKDLEEIIKKLNESGLITLNKE
jgi:hypothetical protein